MPWGIIAGWWPWVLGCVLLGLFFPRTILKTFYLFPVLFGLAIMSWYRGKLLVTVEWWLQLLNCWLSEIIDTVLKLSLSCLTLIVCAGMLSFAHDWFMKDDASANSVAISVVSLPGAPVKATDGGIPVDVRDFIKQHCPAAIWAEVKGLLEAVWPTRQLWSSGLYLIALVVATSLHLFLRYGSYSNARFTNSPDDVWQIPGGKLLPTQRVAFEEIRNRIGLFSLQQEPLVLAVEGDWGSGKSYVTRALDAAYKPQEWLIYHRAIWLMSHDLPNWPAAMKSDQKTSDRSDDQRCRDRLWVQNAASGKKIGGGTGWMTQLRRFMRVVEKLIDRDEARIYFLFPSERTFRRSDREASRDRPLVSDRSTKHWPDKVIFIKTDAWKFATEEELHWGLLEALLSHPHVPPPFRFLMRTSNLFRYPLVVIPVCVIRVFQFIFHRGRITLPGGAAFSFQMSGMLWQRQLETTIDKIRDDKGIVVWCLDEIDRSSAEMAQASITMIRRFLSFPGVITIVPYVNGQLHYKVFNPLQPTRPDLEATIFSVLWQDWMRKGFNSPEVKTPATQLGLEDATPKSGLQAAGDRSQSLATAVEAYGIKNMLPQNLENVNLELLAAISITEPTGSVQRLVKAHLIQHYLNRNQAELQELQFVFEEKYLRQGHISLKRLRPEDVGEMLLTFEELRDPIERLIDRKLREHPGANSPPQTATLLLNTIRASVVRVITKAHEKIWASNERPVLRHLVDEIRQKLAGLDNYDEQSPQHSNLFTLLSFALTGGRALQLLGEFLERDRSLESVLKELETTADSPGPAGGVRGPVLDESSSIVMLIVFLVLVAYRRASLRLEASEIT